MDSITRREIIMDNYEHPTNRGLKEDPTYIKKNTRSASCIDNIEMMMKVEDGIIKDIVFDGEACAICTSATSIMIRKLIGKTKEEALNIIDNYKKMINEEEYDHDLLEELLAYDEIYLQPNRKNCALLPSKTIENILDEVGDNNGNSRS